MQVANCLINWTDFSAELKLSLENLDEAIKKINTSIKNCFTEKEVEQFKSMLIASFWNALPYFHEGSSLNPIYHNTQVLDNMVQIGLGEQLNYREFKISVITALLHDIGNAISLRPKVKTDQVKEAVKENTPERAKELAYQAIEFRLEHMDNGPALLAKVTAPMIEDGTLGRDELHLICRAVLIHDYPSIEEVLTDLRNLNIDTPHQPGDFLLPFDTTVFGRLIERLREADRLFMVTEQGVEKDLRDGNKDINKNNLRAKLISNADKHRREFRLYEKVRKIDGFQDNTLYRTKTGYDLYCAWVKKLEAKWAS